MIKKFSDPAFYTVILLLTGMIFPPISSSETCPLDSLKPKRIESLQVFKSIPVLDQGRIKPLDTFLRNFLLQLSGRSRYQKESATQWGARFLFAPRTTFDDKVFLINNPEIAEALKVEPEKHRRYSYHQLEYSYDKLRDLARAAHSINEKQRSVVESEILRVYQNVSLFLDLSGTFMYAFIHPDFTIDSPEVLARLEFPDNQTQFSFYDILLKSDSIYAQTRALETKKESDWSEADRIMARLVNSLVFWTEFYSNCPFHIIPSRSPGNEQWFSPMDTIISGFQDPVLKEEIKALRNMTIHYWNGEQLEFNLAAGTFKDSVLKRSSPKQLKVLGKIPLELFYNGLMPFIWAKLLYGLAFSLFLLSLLRDQKGLRQLSFGAVIAGGIPHLMALVLRITIMSRPPVSNLYETFIFVGFIAVFLGVALEVINKNWLGNVVASVCGLIFLFIAGKFSSDGDTMQMLVAVLDSNFWLSTHVIAITTGYAGCCVAGIMGHVYILQAFLKSKDKKLLDVTSRNLLGILGFGLTMTLLGTALGGIWADQSWGRFWGWDPKENGALMIVLWCAIIFHARIGKLINQLGVAVCSVFGLIVVMWAWFGVNLLSVGLHSYGFTTGVANGLIAYIAVEFVLMILAVSLLPKKGFKF